MNFETRKNNIFDLIRQFSDCNEQQQKSLEEYVSELLKANQQFNFIGKSTIENIWDRHILDCAQLLKFIPDKTKKFADFGAGAGLPGFVLSILGIKEIHLIEKSFRKSDFLKMMKPLSQNRIFVHQATIEELGNVDFDCIVSRALAPLPKLLSYCQKFLKKSDSTISKETANHKEKNESYCLFLKGKNLPQEIKNAEEIFEFEYELFPSLTSDESNIIRIKKIREKIV